MLDTIGTYNISVPSAKNFDGLGFPKYVKVPVRSQIAKFNHVDIAKSGTLQDPFKLLPMELCLEIATHIELNDLRYAARVCKILEKFKF